MPKVDEKRGLWVGGEGGTREGGDIFQTEECIHVTSDITTTCYVDITQCHVVDVLQITI